MKFYYFNRFKNSGSTQGIVSLYQDDAIPAAVGTWADTVAALT